MPLLHIALGNKASLVLDHTSSLVLLELEDLLHPNGMRVVREIHQGLCPVLLGVHLAHGQLQCWITLYFNELKEGAPILAGQHYLGIVNDPIVQGLFVLFGANH